MAKLSQPLHATFTQKYDYFALSALGLTRNRPGSPSRLEYTYQPLPETARPMLHIVARKADGRLYHMAAVLLSIRPSRSHCRRVVLRASPLCLRPPRID